jgi:hypothetical protein
VENSWTTENQQKTLLINLGQISQKWNYMPRNVKRNSTGLKNISTHKGVQRG